MNNWLSHTIRLIANRTKCSECFAGSSEAIFKIGDNIIYKIPINIKSEYFPIFKGKSGKMILHKYYELHNSECIIRICTRCGTSRKVGIPNRFS